MEAFNVQRKKTLAKLKKYMFIVTKAKFWGG
jgi:hypothetical protein